MDKLEYDVELEKVTKSFGDQVAVDSVSFRVPRGSFFSLLGPSGCGKSTTLRMASGFEQPDFGVLRIAGEDMSRVPPYRRPTNMVFQRWALFPHMTVFDNVAFGPSTKRVPAQERRKRVSEALQLVSLQDYSQRKPGQLSGGQMQRVALARALVNQPKVLLLDEPLGALDLKLRNQMQMELKRIQKEVGTTFVYVTHDQGEAMTMSDQIAVMNKARIEQVGSPSEIYDKPASRFVADFIGNTNLLPVQVTVSSLDGAQVRFGSTSFVVNTTEKLNSGPAVMSLRLEQVKVGRDRPDLDATMAVCVRDVVFHGGAMRYVLVPEGIDAEINAEVSHGSHEARFNQGEQIYIGWNAAAVRLFSDG